MDSIVPNENESLIKKTRLPRLFYSRHPNRVTAIMYFFNEETGVIRYGACNWNDSGDGCAWVRHNSYNTAKIRYEKKPVQLQIRAGKLNFYQYRRMEKWLLKLVAEMGVKNVEGRFDQPLRIMELGQYTFKQYNGENLVVISQESVKRRVDKIFNSSLTQKEEESLAFFEEKHRVINILKENDLKIKDVKRIFKCIR